MLRALKYLAGTICVGIILATAAFSTSAAEVTGVGANTYGQITIPGTATNVATVAAGRDFSVATRTNGTVIAWGYSGDSRVAVPATATNVLQVSAGIYHTLALRANGTVVGWGYNASGALSIPADLTNVVAVAAGGYHSLALRHDGTVVGWGYTGNGRTVAPPTLTDIVAICAGRDHSVALKSDGTVFAWGLNDFNQCTVPAGLTNVVAISAGATHTLALLKNGSVIAWGDNSLLQCSVPASVTNKAVAISAGMGHSLALLNTGAVVGWGDNSSGQLNLTGTTNTSIAAGGSHSLADRNGGPLITSQPKSLTVLAGANVQFSVTAVGTGLKYQWFWNGLLLTNQTSSTLSLTAVGTPQTGLYSVKVANASSFTMSQGAALLVRSLQQLTAPKLVAPGTLRLTFGDENGEAITAPNVARYQVQVSSDLKTWTVLSSPIILVGGVLQVDDSTVASAAQRFYRVVEK